MMNRTNRIAILALALFALATGAAFTQTISHTLNLTGNVPQIFEFTISATNVDLGDISGGIADEPIATLRHRTNNRAGYSIVVSTPNYDADGNPTLVGTTVDGQPAPDSVPYTLKLQSGTDTSTLSFSSGSASIVDATAKSSGWVDQTLVIAIDSTDTWVNADDYSDTLTFTMTAK